MTKEFAGISEDKKRAVHLHRSFLLSESGFNRQKGGGYATLFLL